MHISILQQLLTWSFKTLLCHSTIFLTFSIFTRVCEFVGRSVMLQLRHDCGTDLARCS